MRAADQIQSLGVVRTTVEKPLQRIARVAVLAGSDVGRADLAPNLMQRVRLIALDDLLEMSDGIRQAILGAGDATQLIVGVQFFRIDVDGPMKTLASLIQFPALLMNQT